MLTFDSNDFTSFTDIIHHAQHVGTSVFSIGVTRHTSSDGLVMVSIGL